MDQQLSISGHIFLSHITQSKHMFFLKRTFCHYLCSFQHLWILQAFSDQWRGKDILCRPIRGQDYFVSTNSSAGPVLSRPMKGWHCGRWAAGQELWCSSFGAIFHCEQKIAMQRKQKRVKRTLRRHIRVVEGYYQIRGDMQLFGKI